MKCTTPAILTLLFLILLSCTACGGGSNSSSPSETTPLGSTITAEPPAFQQWFAQMSNFGRVHCETIRSSATSFDERLGSTYYDAIWVFQQIRDFTGDASWQQCVTAAIEVYGKGFVGAAEGQVPGYWNFSHGLKNGNGSDHQLIALLIERAAFSGVQTPLEWTADQELSREVAYTIMTYLNARAVGLAFPEERLFAFVGQALGHIDQWSSGRAAYVRPFMIGLTAQALIEYFEAYQDPAVLPALEKILDYIWERTWIRELQAFQYTDRQHESGGTEPAPDLNLLIAPAYMWLALQTASEKHFHQADMIFAGGVSGSYLGGAKQFNQNYRWSFAYLRWRQQAISLGIGAQAPAE